MKNLIKFLLIFIIAIYHLSIRANEIEKVIFTIDDISYTSIDLDNRKIYWHKNGTYINSGDPTSGATGTGARAVLAPTTPGGFYVFTAGADNTGIATIEINTGSPSYTISSGNADGKGFGNFEYAVPSGYLALCTKNIGSNG